MKRAIPIAAALLTTALMTANASANFQVCNRKAVGIWVSYAYYVQRPSAVYSECDYSKLQGDCYYSSSWKTIGWYRILPNACYPVYGSKITNRYSYVYVEGDDGSVLNDGPLFSVRNDAYSWDEYVSTYYGSGECVVTSGTYDFCSGAEYQVGHHKVDTQSYGDFILSIY